MNTPPVTAVALAAMLLVAGAFACVALAARPPSATAEASSLGAGARRGVGVERGRVWRGVVVGAAVLVVTGWPVLAVVAGVLAASWSELLRDRAADDERRRIEGIAKWLEDLRDTLRGSSVGPEEALEQVALRAPDAVREPLARFVTRRRQGFRTEDALADLADELAHPASDAAIAAIRLVVTGSAGAGRLFHTVTVLAATTRDEVRARERVDRTRAVYRSSMTRLVVIAAVLVGFLRIVSGELLAPYGTPAGQLVLLVPLSLWAGCVLWLRSLCRYEVPGRYRIARTATRTTTLTTTRTAAQGGARWT